MAQCCVRMTLDEYSGSDEFAWVLLEKQGGEVQGGRRGGGASGGVKPPAVYVLKPLSSFETESWVRG